MHTTLSLRKCLPVLLAAATLLTGCGTVTKKTFLGEPVESDAGTLPPMTRDEDRVRTDGLARNPALDSEVTGGLGILRGLLTPYRINIQQGNFISYEMLDRVQPGMTREQVRFALGTPLITDIFRDNRWDYAFRLQKPDGELTNNRVVVFFEGNRVSRIYHDPLLHEADYVDAIMTPTSRRKKTTTRIAPVAPAEASYAADPDHLYEGAVLDPDDPIAQVYATDAQQRTPGTAADTRTPPVSPEKPEIAPVLIPIPAPLIEEEPVAVHEEAIVVHEEPVERAPRPVPAETVRPVPTVPDAMESAYFPEETVPEETVPAVTPAPTAEPTPVMPVTEEPLAAPVAEPTPVTPADKELVITPVPVVEMPAAPPAQEPGPAVPAPEPVRQVIPPGPATPAGADTTEGEYEDFQAAPHSVRQLEQLMQSR